MWLMMALPLLWLDMIQDPEIQTPDLIVAGEPITLMCVVPGICLDSKALSIIWKGPAVSSVSSDHFIVAANASSSVIRFTPRPEDHGTTLECHLNFFPTNSTKRTAIVLSIHSPAKLMHFSCTKKKTMLCTCAFHGFPMPTFQWFLGEVPVGVESMHNIFQVVYNMLEPWANSTIGLRGDPETLQKLHCEGKNIYGTHSSRIFLRPNRVSSTELFYRGLIQGIVFGLIGTSLLFLCLILFLIEILRWWQRKQMRNATAPNPKKSESMKEMEILQSTKSDDSRTEALQGPKSGDLQTLQGPKSGDLQTLQSPKSEDLQTLQGPKSEDHVPAAVEV